MAEDRSERKLATVLFADLAGSTALAGEQDPARPLQQDPRQREAQLRASRPPASPVPCLSRVAHIPKVPAYAPSFACHAVGAEVQSECAPAESNDNRFSQNVPVTLPLVSNVPLISQETVMFFKSV